MKHIEFFLMPKGKRLLWWEIQKKTKKEEKIRSPEEKWGEKWGIIIRFLAKKSIPLYIILNKINLKKIYLTFKAFWDDPEKLKKKNFRYFLF